MNLKNIILGKTIEIVHYWLLRARGRAERGVMAKGCRVSFWGNDNVLKLIAQTNVQFCLC